MSSSAAIRLGNVTRLLSISLPLYEDKTGIIPYLFPFISLVQLPTRSVTQINGTLLVTCLWEKAKPNYKWKTFFFNRAFMFTPHGSAQEEGRATVLRVLENSVTHICTAACSIYRCSPECIYASLSDTSLYVTSMYDLLIPCKFPSYHHHLHLYNPEWKSTYNVPGTHCSRHWGYKSEWDKISCAFESLTS